MRSYEKKKKIAPVCMSVLVYVSVVHVDVLSPSNGFNLLNLGDKKTM